MAQTAAQISSTEPATSANTRVSVISIPDVKTTPTQLGADPAPLYKIVRVRKPDGTIVKVRRPITTEASQIQNSPKKADIPRVEATNLNIKEKVAVAGSSSEVSVKSDNNAPKHDKKAAMVATSPTAAASIVKAQEDAKLSGTGGSEDSKTPTEPIVTSKTDRALDSATRGARIYRGLRMLHRGSSRLVGVLAPEWDIDGLEDGDEEISDDDDDDDEDEERYDSDEDNNDDNGNNEKNDKDDKDNQRGSSSLLGMGKSESQGIANAAVSNIGTLKTPRVQPAAINPKPATIAKKGNQSDKAAVLSEREIIESDLEKGSLEKPSANAATEGRNLTRNYKDWSRYVIWGIIIIFPLLFIAVGILVACRDKKPVGTKYGNGTNQALQIAISVWPIIFAGIVAQSLRAYATYKVERGVQLMTLEQLVNSNSVAASFKQPFLLRRFNWITAALLTLWGLSPLATQAMQRISSTGDLVTDTSLRFVNTTANEANYLAADSGMFDTIRADFDRLYSAAFLPSNLKILGADSYNNALIPILNSSVASDKWQNTDPTSIVGLPDYASLYGIPVAAPDQTISASTYVTDSSIFNITLTTGYLSFSCDPMTTIPSTDITSTQYLNLTSGVTGETTLRVSMTPMSAHQNGTLALASLITLNTTGRDPINYTLSETNSTDFGHTWAYTSCKFWQTFVEANVSCQSSLCYTTAVRPTQPEDTPVQLDSGSANWESLLQTPSETIKLDSGTTNHLVLTNAELYLYNQTPPGSQVYGVDFTVVPHDTFVSSLAFMMNSFWTIGFAPKSISVINVNGSSEVASGGNSLPALVPPESYAFGIKIQPQAMFITSWGWLAALIICSTILLLAGILSIWWDARTVSPDVLGFASSVIRKSKYVQLPKVEGTASGAERARALGEVRVMMQDVKPTAEVGRIALGTAHPHAKRLVPGRNYR